jgi:alkaline phosphatase
MLRLKEMRFKITALILVSVLSFALAPAVNAKGRPRLGQLSRNIILIIGDGMNIEHEIASSRYLYGKDFGLSFHQLPYQGNVATWDVDTYKHWSGGKYDPIAIVPTMGYDPDLGGSKPYPLEHEPPGAEDYLKAAATDSASAATAWATGHKTDAGNLAWLPGDPDDGELETIAELLREEKGYAIGVVSTVPFTHATPAAHVSHNVSRNNYHEIGKEILTEVKPDVVIGGGHPGFDGNLIFKYISRADYTAFKDGAYSNKYVFVERLEGVDGGISLLKAAQQAVEENKKLFGLFGIKGSGNFESLEPHDFPATPSVKQRTNENPTFAEATLAALRVLSQDEDGLFLMAEQGDIDWANHANDFHRMVGTIYDLHMTVQAVIDFVNQPGDNMDWNNTLFIVTSDHGNSYMRNRTVLGAGDLPEQSGQGSCGYDSYEPCTYPNGEVSYGATDHTNELVRLYAHGAGAMNFKKYEDKWYPGSRILDNTQIFQVMMEAAGMPEPSPLKLSRHVRK